MKVLFAVNNDKISEAVIKRYPKEYKELLSYKNVYYFNAILKEIQNDKSYDRIVISEDLEPFVNTNNDSIDNFLFSNLDRISDEAQGNDGKEIAIILICSERRTFGSNILNKLFSIGIYNALIGNDRSLDNLCKLINRPRTKKEAKIYYRIDQATYESAVDNGEVSETEIQNILNHFKKLGKNTDRYTDSFNNIAAQYTDDQLRLIINVLPMKVKAVLEAESEKYQSLMGTTGDERRRVEPVEPGISVNTIGSGREPNVNGPIVIPSGVKRFTSGRNVVTNRASNLNQSEPQVQPQARPVQPQPVRQAPVQQVQPQVQARPAPMASGNTGNRIIPQNMARRVNPVQQEQVQAQPVQNNINQVQRQVPQAQQPVQRVQQPPVQPIQQVQAQVQASPVEQVPQEQHKDLHNEKRYTGTIEQVKRTLIARRKANPASAQTVTSVAPTQEVEEPVVEEKRGRGRPRKVTEDSEVNKPKRGRGRPKKVDPAEEENNNLDGLLSGIGSSSTSNNDENILPGLEDDTSNDNSSVLPGLDDTADDSNVLPGLDDNTSNDNSGVLPGLDDNTSNDNSNVLPGAYDEDSSGTLPGLDDSDNDDGEGEDVDVNSLLAGLDDDDDEPSTSSTNTSSNSSTTLPGLDDEDDDSNILPGLDDNTTNSNSNDDDLGTIPGLDDLDDLDNDASAASNSSNSNTSGISGLDDDDEDDEETILPGMGFEDDDNNTSNNNGPQNSNSIQSIEPQIKYSTSNLNSLLTKDKKIVVFVGTTKNGTSFLINNLALMFSMMGIDTAILDMTQNKNSYYLFTDSREELRKIAYTSLSKLENGYADGIKFNKNLTVYTGLPSDTTVYDNAEPILSTLVQNHSLILIDADFKTPPAYFASSQEIYLVQSMDILTIQPLTEFLRDLKFKGAWEPEKARVVINKEVPIRILSNSTIIGGMSRYNGADMSVMTDLFNKDMVKACSIPFDEKVYAKYLETLATCKLSISSLPKQFRAKLQILAEMVYPRLSSKTSYTPGQDYNSGMNMNMNQGGSTFSNNTNNILNKMKRKF